MELREYFIARDESLMCLIPPVRRFLDPPELPPPNQAKHPEHAQLQQAVPAKLPTGTRMNSSRSEDAMMLGHWCPK
jgi:hypothetical protein